MISGTFTRSSEFPVSPALNFSSLLSPKDGDRKPSKKDLEFLSMMSKPLSNTDAVARQHQAYLDAIANSNPTSPLFIYIDLFCGAGGTTIGVKDAIWRDGNPLVIIAAAVNHDPKAIISHWKNHPEVAHYEEDIRKLDIKHLVRLINLYRAFYPHAKIVLGASLECVNFSRAKGGLPRDRDSRTLANDFVRYVQEIDPDYIQIENVEEFMSWGPLDEHGKPISKKNGIDYLNWVESVKKFGYRFDYRLLNAADFGAYTKRVRYFGCFAKGDLPIAWPEPTHAKNGGKAKADMFGETGKQKWKAVKDVLDFEKEGKSIFDSMKPFGSNGYQKAKKYLGKAVQVSKSKKGVESVKLKQVVVIPKWFEQPHFGLEPKLVLTQGHALTFETKVSTYCECIGVEVADLSFYKYEPLCDKSLARVYEGLIKYVAGGQKAFIQQRNGGEPASRVTDLDQPSRTLTATGGNLQLVQTNAFLSKYFSGDAKTMNISTDGPCGSVTTKDHHSLVQVVDRAFITKYLSNNSKTGSNPGASISHPAPTITTQNRLGLVQVTDSNMVSSFISQYYSNGGQHSDVESPCGSLTTKDRMCLIQAKRLLHLNQGSEGVKSGVKANWLDKNYSGKANHESVEQPAGAILSKPKFSLVTSHFIDKQFSSGAKNQSVEEPHGSLLTVPKSNLVRIERGWLMNTNFNNVGSSLQGPAPTLVASRRHSYLIQGVFAGQEQDASTLNLYRHGQAPAHLLCDESGGSTVILVFDTDSELVVKIKEFMSIYGITDIKLRMLFVRELLRIQGFPGDYFLAGSQSDQKKFIGNSVVPVVPKKWLEALAGELFEYTQMKLAA